MARLHVHPSLPFSPEELASEQWRPIRGRENFYSVSSLGRVRSEASGRILAAGPDPLGYPQVNLRVPGIRANAVMRVHRLVAAAFLPGDEGRRQVNHIDLDKRNNRVTNLEWVTAGENMRHAGRAGILRPHTPSHGDSHWMRLHPDRVLRGEHNPFARLTEADVRKMRRLRASGWSLDKLAPLFATTKSHVSRIVRREAWAHVS